MEKFPKEEGGGMVGDVKRVCDLCGKEFSSGKALGGHMRIHGQQQGDLAVRSSLKPQKQLKKKHQRLQAPDLVDFVTATKEKKKDSDSDSICTVCLKQFPSMKALFGHMRCHPDRGWRGINPPIKAYHHHHHPCSSSSSITCSSSSISGSDPMAEGWAVRGRRGRKAVAPGSDAVVAATTLVMLGGRGFSVESAVTQFDESDAVNSFCNQVQIQISGVKEIEVGVVTNTSEESIRKVEDRDDGGGHINSCSYQNVSEDFGNGEVVIVNRIRSKKKEEKLCQLKSSPINFISYKCKAFAGNNNSMLVPTHQASVCGGHAISMGDQNGHVFCPKEESAMSERMLEFDLNKMPPKGELRIPSAS